MYESKDILAGARALRPYLTEKLDTEEEAVKIDNELATLLAKVEEGGPIEPLANKVIDIVRTHNGTREWMQEFLKDRVPPEVTRSYQPLPGKPSRPSPPVYECPLKDYTWYRAIPGQEVPQCPTHHIDLILKDD